MLFLNGISANASEGENDPFIWWLPGAAGRLPDGRAEQVVTLEVSPVIAGQKCPLERPEVWLRITTRPVFLRADGKGETFWCKGDWSSSDPRTLIIQSDEYIAVDAFARAEIEGRPHFAQIQLMLYGNTKDIPKEREDRGEDPAWPEFQVRSSGETYWPQTGHEFSLNFSGEIAGSHAGSFLEIRGDQGELVDEVQSTENVYRYTPAHDPALNRAGDAAAKPVIFVARTGEGGAASYTQMVHRSRYAGWNKNAGLGVFAAAFVLSGLAVGLVRRKIQPCA